MRTCDHMPGAAKHVECKLCKDIAAGGPLSKAAIVTLNSQRPKEPTRACPKCGGKSKALVTREGVLMCQECAEELDE